jgi:uncharacterized protein YuzE
MKTQYDPETDAFYVRFADGKVLESQEVSPGIILNFDAHNRVIGLEVLDARTRLASGALVAAAE